MNIVLVRGNERPDAHTPIAEANVTGIYPPLGIAYVAASLRRQGHKVRILDAHALNLSVEAVARNVKNLGDDVVGVTSTSLNWLRCLRLLQAVKRQNQRLKVMVGGPHVALFGKLVAALPEVDAVVTGEGEFVTDAVLRRWAEGLEPQGVPGVVYRSVTGAIIDNGPATVVSDLDSLPFPAVDLLPLREYRALTIRKPFFTMLTSRGCPYSCGFCSQIYAGGSFRQRSPDNVVEEMAQYVEKYQARELILFDETFTIGEARVLKICELIRNRNLRFRWNIRARADTVTKTMAQELKAAGCYGIHIGVESGNRDLLVKMKKEITLEQVEHAFRVCREAGLETRGYFMLGYPGETRATMEETIALSLTLQLDWASYSITVPHPATAIFSEAVSLKLLEADYWEQYTRGAPPGPLPYFTTPEYSKAELEGLARKAYLRFYGRPTKLLAMVGSARLLANVKELLPTLWYLHTRRDAPEQ